MKSHVVLVHTAFISHGHGKEHYVGPLLLTASPRRVSGFVIREREHTSIYKEQMLDRGVESFNLS